MTRVLVLAIVFCALLAGCSAPNCPGPVEPDGGIGGTGCTSQAETVS
jgi:hypothetical protein